MKLKDKLTYFQILKVMQDNGIKQFTFDASGSGDSGSLDSVHCETHDIIKIFKQENIDIIDYCNDLIDRYYSDLNWYDNDGGFIHGEIGLENGALIASGCITEYAEKEINHKYDGAFITEKLKAQVAQEPSLKKAIDTVNSYHAKQSDDEFKLILQYERYTWENLSDEVSGDSTYEESHAEIGEEIIRIQEAAYSCIDEYIDEYSHTEAGSNFEATFIFDGKELTLDADNYNFNHYETEVIEADTFEVDENMGEDAIVIKLNTQNDIYDFKDLPNKDIQGYTAQELFNFFRKNEIDKTEQDYMRLIKTFTQRLPAKVKEDIFFNAPEEFQLQIQQLVAETQITTKVMRNTLRDNNNLTFLKVASNRYSDTEAAKTFQTIGEIPTTIYIRNHYQKYPAFLNKILSSLEKLNNHDPAKNSSLTAKQMESLDVYMQAFEKMDQLTRSDEIMEKIINEVSAKMLFPSQGHKRTKSAELTL